MLDQRLKAAAAIKADLLPAEEAIDLTLAKLGRLASTMFTARIEAKLAMSYGQAAATHVTSAMALLGEARGHIVAAHADLGNARAKVLPTVSWGDDDEKENPKAIPLREHRHVRAA